MTSPCPLPAALAGALILTLIAGGAGAQEPLSASDWLSGSVQTPPRAASAWRPGTPPPPDAVRQRPPRPPVARTGLPGAVRVTRLGDADPAAAGTLSAREAGLPPDLWNGATAAEVRQALASTPARLPAMTDLMRRLINAQLAPPVTDAAEAQALFTARVDRLLDMGDLAGARALMAQAPKDDPDLFRRTFDIALLEGDESRACATMDSTPGIAPSMAARIFCLAQSGDWAAAALVFHGAEDLRLLDPARALLLRQYLDDAWVDEGGTLTPPDPVTPLDFRMHEAVGQPLPTPPLPLAFAWSDLRPNSGWKARVEAAERLARAGVLGGGDLTAIYAEQRPAASGGVWDRAAAWQALAQAMGTERAGAVLDRAAEVFAAAGLGGALATMVAPEMDRLPEGPTAQMLRRWLFGEDAVATPAADVTGVKGLALLGAMADIDAGLDGDQARAARGLAGLDALGLAQDAARARAQLTLAPRMMQPR